MGEGEIVAIFQENTAYESEWLKSILDEISRSTSTDFGLLRPNDRLGKELRPISGFEGFDRFDWLPSSVYRKITVETTLSELIEFLWKSHLDSLRR